MEISGLGYIIQISEFGENMQIISIFTKENGKYNGIIRKSKKNFFQIGDEVDFIWKARVESQLGKFNIELKKRSINSFLKNKFNLLSINVICNVLVITLPERLKYNVLFNYFENLINLKNESNNKIWIYNYIIFEITLMTVLGYGFNLDEIMNVGLKNSDLKFYINLKSSKIISEVNKLKSLKNIVYFPKFMLEDLKEEEIKQVSISDLYQAMKLNEYFLKKHFANIKKKSEKYFFDERSELFKTSVMN